MDMTRPKQAGRHKRPNAVRGFVAIQQSGEEMRFVGVVEGCPVGLISDNEWVLGRIAVDYGCDRPTAGARVEDKPSAPLCLCRQVA